MEITFNNDKVVERLEVLRMAVKGAERLFDEWVDKESGTEFTGLSTAFYEFEMVLNDYVQKADPVMSAIYRNQHGGC